MDIEKIIKNLVRTGQVSSVNAADCSARVAFDDKDDTVSADLPILIRGSKTIKDYWLPDIGEQVLCLFLPNGDNLNDGFILATYFSEIDAPSITDKDKRTLDFGDGTVITYDRAAHEMTINSTGAININASGGDVVVNGISLVHHTHLGCQGGSTGQAQ